MRVPASSVDYEDLWDDLLAFIEERRVIPVVGAELLEVDESGTRVPLYRAVAVRLLQRYGLAPAASGEAASESDAGVVLRPRHELNDAVCALAQRGRRVQDLYRPVSDTLRAVLAQEQVLVPAPLADLASIPAFDLFVSTTCDDLLARAIDAARFDGREQTQRIEYAPNLSSDRFDDIPELRSTGHTAVFHVLGRASASPQFAIHDEDVLEFVYSLQAGRGHVPERMLAALRSRNLLIVGCNFVDWLGRFFIRGANPTRLFGDRVKREFLADGAASTDGSLTLFLERFSQNTRVFPGTAAEFVRDLKRRWEERHPSALRVAAPELSAPPMARRSDIFVSYAREDRGAVRKLVEHIKALGGDVVWFDRHDLSIGDDWQAEITSAIRRSGLFLAIMSANTERRTEGFFRREWDEACQRNRAIQGRKFMIPVVIDAEYGGDPARYQLVPEAFRDYQFGHAPAGEPGPPLRQQLVDALRAWRRVGSG